MRYGFLHFLALIALAGCPGGGGGIGETCSGQQDCDSTLQCADNVCVPKCARAPECGDGHSCSEVGSCVLANGQPGDGCTSEVDCAPGLSCEIDGTTVAEGHLIASCTAQSDGKPAGGSCFVDADCRNGTCALGQCTDLCSATRDCAVGYSCMDIPKVEVGGALYAGCLPSSGNITWTIPIHTPSASIMLPVPSAAQYAQLVFSVGDDAQRVGAESMIAPLPASETLYSRPCINSVLNPRCDPVAEFFANIVRHQPEFGQSVISIPASPQHPLETGAYRVQLSSYRPNGLAGSAIPRVTALVRIDTATLLDLRFHFLDLADHMCQSAFGNKKLDAASAQSAVFFQDEFVAELRAIFAHGGIALGNLSYDDIANRPDLDSLDVASAKDLLSLGTGSTGVNVFFVRSLSPVGLQAFGPNPGPSGLGSTRQSGIAIGVDTMCFRSWKQLARLTAHELARYMGLSHNRELAVDGEGKPYTDSIDDSDTNSGNLMFFTELGGTEISPGQRDILSRSGVLR